MDAPLTSIYDVVIEGAGPAGCSAAIELARAGRRALLFDKGMPGSGKVCGGFLGPEVLAYVRGQGLEIEWSRLGAGPIPSVIVSGPRTPLYECAVPGGGGLALERDRFDRWILDRALERGASFLPETRLAGRALSRGLWRLRLEGLSRTVEVFARAYVRASGRRQPKGDPGGSYFAVKTEYERVRGLDGRVALHFVRHGHVGLNPIGPGRATMCLYVEGRTVRSAGGDFDRMMTSLTAQNEHLASQLDGARRTEGWKSCRAVPDGRLDFYRDGAYCAGDAVTMVNPIVGGGIPVALGGAAVLGRLLGRDVGRRSPSEIAAEYARQWRREFAGRVRLASALGRIERSETLTRFLFGFLRWQPTAFHRLVRLSRARVLPAAANV